MAAPPDYSVSQRVAELNSRVAGCACLVFLLACCDKKSGETGPAGSPAHAPAAIPAAAAATETAAQPVAPGLDRKKYIGPLQDAYERIDPAKDGWESEAFNTAAMEQLHALEHLLAGVAPITSDQLKDIVAGTIRTTPLRPANPVKVLDDGRMLVFRATTSPNSAAPGVESFAVGLNSLKGAGISLAPHFKIFRVSRVSASSVNTSVIVEIAANSDGERRQINGEWSCTWLTPAEGAPMLDAVTVTRFEEVVQKGSEPLFADATASILGKNPSWRDQLLVPTDYWRARLPRDLGLDAVANHGLAIGDVNGDDLDDLYICQQGGLPNRLFIQNPDGTLRDVTGQSGTGWLDYCAAALLVDVDNDGDRDLIISQDFRVLIMSNDGTGKFTMEFGSNTRAQSFSLAAADYDHDGLLDFYTCGYNASTAELRSGAMGEPMPFHDANNGGQNMLWRNNGNFHFTDVTAATGLEQNNTRYTFAATWEDYDNDGDQDLYVANDYGRNCLYRNDHGKFTDVAAALGVEDTSSGMSVSWSDFDHDGWMDLYTSNMFSSAGSRITYQRQFKADMPAEVKAQFQHIAVGNSLFQATPGGAFKDVSIPAGVTLGRWAWGSKFVDFNNDGFDDILVANGFISTADSGDL